MHAKRKCPRCGKGTLDYRVHREQWVKSLLFWLPLKRYECSSCMKKSYVLKKQKRKKSGVL